ncbi:hypothetical protein X474_21665 [Dethiosulfatarculus sandiegensis]|uniref:Uncharacterized protein n=1 Tax=Dethiosulfatarculus sandiegensis TaxID=1429043 RepID=A0A0D2J8C0_9BACT|nr:hypothetical protein X474_21665 [Dethiosulfatarculus sandiegensis]
MRRFAGSRNFKAAKCWQKAVRHFAKPDSANQADSANKSILQIRLKACKEQTDIKKAAFSFILLLSSFKTTGSIFNKNQV